MHRVLWMYSVRLIRNILWLIKQETTRLTAHLFYHSFSTDLPSTLSFPIWTLRLHGAPPIPHTICINTLFISHVNCFKTKANGWKFLCCLFICRPIAYCWRPQSVCIWFRVAFVLYITYENTYVCVYIPIYGICICKHSRQSPLKCSYSNRQYVKECNLNIHTYVVCMFNN